LGYNFILSIDGFKGYRWHFFNVRVGQMRVSTMLIFVNC